MSDTAAVEKTIFVYDYVGSDGDLLIDREANEIDEGYNYRVALYISLFSRN